MLDLVRKQYFRKEYEVLLTSQDLRAKSEEPNELKSITILCDSNRNQLVDLEEVVAQFRKRGVKTYGYFCTDETEVVKKTRIGLLSKKEASWYRVPNQKVLIDWLSRKTDLLIAINRDQDLFMQYLIAASNSRLKASLDFGSVKRDISIDFYVKVKKAHNGTLVEDCNLIYEMLEELSVLQD